MPWRRASRGRSSGTRLSSSERGESLKYELRLYIFSSTAEVPLSSIPSSPASARGPFRLARFRYCTTAALARSRSESPRLVVCRASLRFPRAIHQELKRVDLLGSFGGGARGLRRSRSVARPESRHQGHLRRPLHGALSTAPPSFGALLRAPVSFAESFADQAIARAPYRLPADDPHDLCDSRPPAEASVSSVFLIQSRSCQFWQT